MEEIRKRIATLEGENEKKKPDAAELLHKIFSK